MRRKKDHVTTCQACHGKGWLPGKLVPSPHAAKIKTPIKHVRCSACGGEGTFKS